MATDLHPTPDHDQLRVPVSRHRRRGMLLVAVSLFQFWVWGTRIVNLVEGADGFPAAFIAVHTVLYVTAIAVGVVLAVLGVRMWRESRPADDGSPR